MTTTPYLKPLPDISEANRPFWEGLQRHEFLVPKCHDCGAFNWPPYPACRSCLSEDQQWTAVSGHASVYTFTIVHRGHGQFNDEAPYAIVLAKLAEEPRACVVLGNTRGIPVEDLHIGMPLTILYEEIPDEDVTLWRFGAVSSTVVTDEMAALIGCPLETLVSFPIGASDIRRWAIAVYYPEPPPRRFWAEESTEAAECGGIVAPDDFNPFAWMPAERRGPGSGIRALEVDRSLSMAGATEHLLGVRPPALSHGLNGGIEVAYGRARMRPGDVITDTASISEYREREGRLGLMLFTTTDHVWTNQHGDHVKTQRLTYIRY